MFTAMQDGRELDVVTLVGNEREGLEDRFEALASAVSSVSDFGEMFEVAGDMTFVPRDQDRFDVWEVEAIHGGERQHAAKRAQLHGQELPISRSGQIAEGSDQKPGIYQPRPDDGANRDVAREKRIAASTASDARSGEPALAAVARR